MHYRPHKIPSSIKQKKQHFVGDDEGVVAGIVALGGKLDDAPKIIETPWGKHWLVHVKEPLLGSEADIFYQNNPDVRVFCNGVECSWLKPEQKARL